jgi:hypothetical protein
MRMVTAFLSDGRLKNGLFQKDISKIVACYPQKNNLSAKSIYSTMTRPWKIVNN